MLNYNDRMNSYLDIPRYIAVYVRGSTGSVSRREREKERAREREGGGGGEEVVIRRISRASFDP